MRDDVNDAARFAMPDAVTPLAAPPRTAVPSAGLLDPRSVGCGSTCEAHAPRKTAPMVRRTLEFISAPLRGSMLLWIPVGPPVRSLRLMSKVVELAFRLTRAHDFWHHPRDSSRRGIRR